MLGAPFKSLSIWDLMEEGLVEWQFVGKGNFFLQWKSHLDQNNTFQPPYLLYIRAFDLMGCQDQIEEDLDRFPLRRQ